MNVYAKLQKSLRLSALRFKLMFYELHIPRYALSVRRYA